MPRRGGKGRRRNRRRNRNRKFQMHINSIIKGTVKYAEHVEISLADFTDMKDMGTVKPTRLELTLTVMNAPTFVSILQWDGETDNSYFNIQNMLINKTKTYKKVFTWPNELFLLQTVTSTQTLIQIIHSAGGDVYDEEKPLIFYMAKMFVSRASDLMNPKVDPPHFNIKHSEPLLIAME